MRISGCALVLLVAGCSPSGSASLVVEARSEAISPDGTLRESVGIETDGQDQIIIHLFRGEAELVSSARSLGKFQVSGIAPNPRGEPMILVEFKADQGGITITASDSHGESRLSLARITP